MDDAERNALADLVAGVEPFDMAEERDRQRALEWINSGADLYRVAKPDVPPMHLVSYFAVADPGSAAILLVEHLTAGLLLPTGGHCEPGETPWQTVRRECPEELGIDAVATRAFGEVPVFVTVTGTCDPHGRGGIHTDVSLWHVVQAEPSQITEFDRSEFSGLRWLTPEQIYATPLSMLDAAMYRFTAKYELVLASAQPER